MSATFGINRLRIESTGTLTNVPNADIAKLMYYIDCVLTVIEYDRNSKLTDYQHYYNLNNEEKKAVFTLAILFKPEIFIDSGIFVVNADLLPNGVSNDFFKITDERIGVHVNQEIMVGGKAVKVLRIMVCKDSWLDNNYYYPIKRIIDGLTPKRLPGQQISPVVQTTQYSSTETIPNSSRQIISNQSTPKEFGLCSTSLTCPYCRTNIATNTEIDCSCGACCLCLCVTLLPYLCIQACRGKNVCCCDSTHTCPHCGKYLGSYKAC